MIDHCSRSRLAELLRSLASGAITNDEFEALIPESSDKAIYEVFFNGGWTLYCDMREYKLKGKYALEKVVKKEVARWILFLKSNYEYSWPDVPLKQRFLYFLSFGLLGTTYKKTWKATGDLEAWPFLTKVQFEIAKEEHGYLGKQNA